MPFKKGEINNPKGRPKGSKNRFSVAELQKAFQKAAKTKGSSILEHLALKAYDDTTLAIALLRKMLPDTKQLELTSLSSDNQWATKSPAEIAREMTSLSMGIPDIPKPPLKRLNQPDKNNPP